MRESAYRKKGQPTPFSHRPHSPQKLLGRREFLLTGSLFATLGFSSARLVMSAEKPSPGRALDAPWNTIALVQEHLFPSNGDGPGAGEIKALQYLRQVIELADQQDDGPFMRNGAGWLEEESRDEYGRPFWALSEIEREELLQRIAQSRAGERWLSRLLTYVMEALLCPPAYGGNPHGIGWKWLEHTPGFPLPGPDKLWYKL